MRASLIAIAAVVTIGVAAWVGAGTGANIDSASEEEAWQPVTANIYRSHGFPACYMIRQGSHAVVVGAPSSFRRESLRELGVTTIDYAFLTHHHRDSVAGVAQLVAEKVSVRAPVESKQWLHPDDVAAFWKTALPELSPGKTPGLRDRSFGVFDYLVHPTGIEGIEYDLEDGHVMTWHNWEFRAVSAPGHSRDHFAYLATNTNNASGDSRILFCGDAFSIPEKLWTPYTTDWHHCYADGLEAASASLRKLSMLKPDLICPEHGPPLRDKISEALNTTADKVERVALLKSFERYTKEVEKDPPSYRFLAKNQVATAGEKPFEKLSPHLFVTGNTYVVASKEGPLLVIDPFGPTIVERIQELQRKEKLGPVELVLITHAHNDHYTGAFQLPNRESWKLWTLDTVAKPIAEPFFYRAPYLDARSLKTDRLLRDGERLTWREFSLRVRHQPGQSYFSMGIETEIDGRKCCITADNFFHADQFTGTGGWSGRNRSFPLMYERSAQQVLNYKPEWVLAEHGGPFEFQREDFQRRVRWARAAGKAADELCLSGSHLNDWNPHSLHVEPFLVQAKAGWLAKAALVATNDTDKKKTFTVTTTRDEIVAKASWKLVVPPGQSVSLPIELTIGPLVDRGRHIVPLVAKSGETIDGSDLFLVIETSQPICLE